VQVGSQQSAPVEGWTRLPDPPLAPRTGATAVWTGTEVVVFGGWEFLCPPGAECSVAPGFEAFRDGAAYDPATETWRPTATAPVGITNTEAVALSGDVYLLSTCSIAPCIGDPTLLRYRPGEDQWDLLPAPSADVGAFRLQPFGSRLLAVSGSDERGERADFLFDPETSTWSELTDDPFPPLYDRHVVADGDDLLLFGKEVESGGGGVVGARLDLASGVWQVLPTAPGSGFQAWGVDGVVVLNPHFGRSAGGGEFDPATSQWSALPAPPDAGSWQGDMAGVLGAETAIYEYSSGWVLDVPAPTWRFVPPVDSRTTFPDTAVTAVGRSLFVFGGEDWSTSRGRLLGDAWLWTPPTPSIEPAIWAHEPSDATEGMGALVEGTVRYDTANECFLLDGIDGVTYPVVWPAGTEAADDGGVHLPDGSVAALGSVVSGGGGYLQAATLDFAIPAACIPPTGEVAVFNPNEIVEVRSD
jgi:hypothetical protein